MAGLQPEAERAGFEPATDLSARTRFPVALLRPLGHLSGPGESTRAGMRRPHGQSPHGLQTAPASRRLGQLGHLSGPGAEYPGKTVAWIIDHFRPARHDPKVCSAVKSASDQKGSR